MALQLHAYDTVTGTHLARLPYSAASWTHSINQPGDLQATIPLGREAASMGLWQWLRCWKCTLALQDGDMVLHAGPVMSLSWDAAGGVLSVTCGGGLTLLSKRLVMDYRVAWDWHDGTVLVDETHPAGRLALTCTGSYPDIIRELVYQTVSWRPLPIDLPEREGGTYTRTWYAWDLATVLDRIGDICDLQVGTEVRLDPYVTGTGSLRWRLRAASPELVDRAWRWNTTLPGVPAWLESVTGDGAGLCTQVWATGGKDDDTTLMCRRTSLDLIDQGWPLLQATDTSHTTVSRLPTLQAHAMATLARGAWPDETFTVKARRDLAGGVHVGDYLDLYVDDAYLGQRDLELKVTDISGDATNEWLTLTCRERG